MESDALEENQKRFLDFAESSSEWFWETGQDHRFTSMFGPALGRFGFDANDYIGKLRSDGINVSEQPEKWKAHYDDLDHRRPFRDFIVKRISRDGVERWASVSGIPVIDEYGTFKGYRGTGTDITDKLSAERNADLASALMIDAIESIPEGFILFDKDDRLVLCNEHYHLSASYLEELLIPGTPFIEIARAIAESGRVLEAHLNPEKWLQDRIKQHMDPGGPFVLNFDDGSSTLITEFKTREGGTAIIRSDISFQKQAERKLFESEKRFRDYAQVSSDWFWEMDHDLRFTYFSGRPRPIEKILTNALGKTRWESVGADPDVDPMWNTHRKTLESHYPFRNFEFSFLSPDDKVLWMQVSGNPVFSDDRSFLGYRGSANNITERKIAEAKLFQSAKLASLGEMATGIAHEINQPLNIIRMAAETLTELLEGEEPPSTEFLKSRLERISSQTQRAADIIDRMRIFGRLPEEYAREISPRDAILTAVSFQRDQLRLDGIDLDLDVPATCRPVMGDVIQLEQVILNLLTNARDAIQEKVALTSGQGHDRVTVKLMDDPASRVIKLIVKDTGGGINNDIMANIFDPFISTKEIGKGTGIGLSISYGIVRGMNGTIVASNTDGGAQFTITLPVVDKIGNPKAEPEQ